MNGSYGFTDQADERQSNGVDCRLKHLGTLSMRDWLFARQLTDGFSIKLLYALIRLIRAVDPSEALTPCSSAVIH